MSEREIKTEELRLRHQSIWDHEVGFLLQTDKNPGLALRTYRAIDWAHRARMEHSDTYAAFLFYWIAFNALYGVEQPKHSDDPGRNRKARRDFFERLLEVDSQNVVLATLRRLEAQAEGLVRSELAYDRPASSDQNVAKRRTLRRVQALQRRLVEGRTIEALTTVFDRLNCIRNWLVHGGISWRSRVMGDAVAECAAILTRLVPTFVVVMLDGRDVSDWPTPPVTPDQHDRPSVKPVPALDTPAPRR